MAEDPQATQDVASAILDLLENGLDGIDLPTALARKALSEALKDDADPKWWQIVQSLGTIAKTEKARDTVKPPRYEWGKLGGEKVTQRKKRTYLNVLAATGHKSNSAKRAKIDRSRIWQWRKADPLFIEAEELAMRMATDMLEDEAWRRATEGDMQADGGIRRSDTMLIFMLKHAKPEKYRPELKIRHEGSIEQQKVVIMERPPPMLEREVVEQRPETKEQDA